MTERNDGGPAFPSVTEQVFEEVLAGEERLHHGLCAARGMSLRDWFAGQALIFLQGYDPAQPDKHNPGNPLVLDTDEVARASYQLADSMLKARDQ